MATTAYVSVDLGGSRSAGSGGRVRRGHRGSAGPAVPVALAAPAAPARAPGRGELSGIPREQTLSSPPSTASTPSSRRRRRCWRRRATCARGRPPRPRPRPGPEADPDPNRVSVAVAPPTPVCERLPGAHPGHTTTPTQPGPVVRRDPDSPGGPDSPGTPSQSDTQSPSVARTPTATPMAYLSSAGPPGGEPAPTTCQAAITDVMSVQAGIAATEQSLATSERIS